MYTYLYASCVPPSSVVSIYECIEMNHHIIARAYIATAAESNLIRFEQTYMKKNMMLPTSGSLLASVGAFRIAAVLVAVLHRFIGAAIVGDSVSKVLDGSSCCSFVYSV
jgi:hypothetical protein